MAPSRRAFVKGTAAAAAVVCAPGRIKAQSAPASARTLRTVLHGDLQVFDPIWTTANMTGNHSLLIYDTLFGMDENRPSLRIRATRRDRGVRKQNNAFAGFGPLQAMTARITVR